VSERSEPLIGRGAELQALQALVLAQPLVTLLGGAGVGKTTLAQAAAAALQPHYGLGVWWVELSGLSDAARVADAVAQVLQVALGRGGGATAAIGSVLSHGPSLLVLDNAEHLLDGVRSLLWALRKRAPRAHVLVTSQQALRLPAEQCMRLGPLSVPAGTSLALCRSSDAVTLFIERARAHDASAFDLNDSNADAVAEICRRLDGIPLALELAAARLPLLGLQGLRDGLDQRLHLLTLHDVTAPPRHRTLRGALAWSHGLLGSDVQVVFRRLGVFAGGFALEAARQVACDDRVDPWAVVEHLGTLVDLSLVLADGDASPRYRLLDSTRLFALERLEAAGESEVLRERHARYFDAALTVTREDSRLWRTPPAPPASLIAEVDNLRAALEWASQGADERLTFSLAAGASHAFLAAALNAEYLQRVLPLRARLQPDVPLALNGRLWSRIALAASRNAHPAGLDAGLRAVEAWRALGDRGRLYDALTWTIAIGARHAQAAAMQPLIEEGLRIEEPGWPPAVRSSFRWAWYRWLQSQGQPEAALQCALSQAELLAQDGHWAMHVAWGANVADCELTLGRLPEAEAHAQQALQALDALQVDENVVGHVMDALVLALTLQRRGGEALPVARRAQRLLEREGDELRLLEPLALHATHDGRWTDAARTIGHVNAAMVRSGETRWPAAAARHAQLQRQLEAVLPAPQLREHLRAGAALSRQQAFELALGDAR
jgi:predicted ATPase